MSFFPKQPIFIGIDLTETNTHLASVRKNKGGWEITSLKSLPKEEALLLLDPAEITVTALPSLETLVRSCLIHIKRERDLKAALSFQIEPLLPYPADRAIIQSQSIEKRENGTSLTVFSVRSDHLQGHLDRLLTRGFEPQRVTCVPLALAALTTFLSQTNGVQFLVYEGEKEVTCLLVEEGKLLASRAFDRSYPIGTEVQKTILSFSNTHKEKKIETILLIGQKSEPIQKATHKTVVFPTAPSLSQEELIRYGLAIGMAIADETINFRQKNFTYPHKWRLVKKPLLIGSTLAAILTLALCGLTQVALKNKKNTIENAYDALVKSEGVLGNQKSPLTTPESYHAALSLLEKKVQERPKTFPLLPTTPNVREFLAWLSTQNSIDIDQIRYSMVKRPDFSQPKERYKIKVELHFSTPSPQIATAFHEVLKGSPLLLDPKEGVQWSGTKGKYQAIFYLMDRTTYSL